MINLPSRHWAVRVLSSVYVHSNVSETTVLVPLMAQPLNEYPSRTHVFSAGVNEKCSAAISAAGASPVPSPQLYVTLYESLNPAYRVKVSSVTFVIFLFSAVLISSPFASIILVPVAFSPVQYPLNLLPDFVGRVVIRRKSCRFACSSVVNLRPHLKYILVGSEPVSAFSLFKSIGVTKSPHETLESHDDSKPVIYCILA